MSTIIREMYSAMIAAMGVEGLKIPMTAVKFFTNGEDLPAPVMHNHIKDITLTNCQASRQASLGDAVCLTRDNIGCVAAAISIGFVDKDDEKPLGGSRVYTDIMRDQSGLGDSFLPPSPPLIHGGEQEFGLPAGTENAGSIAALGEASRLIHSEMEEENKRLLGLRHFFLTELRKIVPDYIVNGSLGNRLPHNLNIGFPKIDSGALLLSLNQVGVYVSAGSACSAGSTEPSHVIKAIGVDTDNYGTIRFSFGLRTTKEDLVYMFKYLPYILEKLGAGG